MRFTGKRIATALRRKGFNVKSYTEATDLVDAEVVLAGGTFHVQVGECDLSACREGNDPKTGETVLYHEEDRETIKDLVADLRRIMCPNCREAALGDCPRCFKSTGMGCPHGPVCTDCWAEEAEAEEAARREAARREAARPVVWAHPNRMGNRFRR